MVEIRINDLSKKYSAGTVIAVDDVSITINDGEFVTFVGPSGSGKSTILRSLAGVVKPTSGSIHFDDRNFTDVPPQERDVAMVFQNYALYPNMTVRGNMEFGLKMQQVPQEERQEKVMEVAEMLDIEELIDRDIQQLSGGQQQRVALGRSIAREPQVFLLDEPLANLDAQLRTEMRSTVVELQRKLDVTTVYVTHNQTEAMTMSDRVFVVNSGEIQQRAPPQELYRNPANKFVADFIGNPSMNFVSCKVENTNENEALATELGRFQIPSQSKHTQSLQAGNNYTLGIRPQDIIINKKQGASTMDVDLVFEVEVIVVETGGHELILHLEKNSKRLTAVVDEAMNISRGEKITMGFDFNDVHVFDETGDNIKNGNENHTEAVGFDKSSVLNH